MSNSNELVPVGFSFNKALEQIEKEWKLDWKEARKLLRVAGSVMLNEASVREAIQMAEAYNLPLRALAMIPTKNGVQPYVTADGFRWAFRIDPRQAKGIKTEIVKFPWDSSDQDQERVAVVKAQAEFLDGSTYTAYGAASSVKAGRENFTDEDLIMLAETKAIRRCLVNAIAFPFRPVEDVLEEQRFEQAKKVEVIDPLENFDVDTFEPDSIASVMIAARSKLDYSIQEICDILDTDNPFKDYQDDYTTAWDKIRSDYAKKEEN